MNFITTRKGMFEESSLDQYLKEISAYPLLTREDEVDLAQRIRTGEEEALDKLVRSNRSTRRSRPAKTIACSTTCRISSPPDPMMRRTSARWHPPSRKRSARSRSARRRCCDSTSGSRTAMNR